MLYCNYRTPPSLQQSRGLPPLVLGRSFRVVVVRGLILPMTKSDGFVNTSSQRCAIDPNAFAWHDDETNVPMKDSLAYMTYVTDNSCSAL